MGVSVILSLNLDDITWARLGYTDIHLIHILADALD